MQSDFEWNLITSRCKARSRCWRNEQVNQPCITATYSPNSNSNTNNNSSNSLVKIPSKWNKWIELLHSPTSPTTKILVMVDGCLTYFTQNLRPWTNWQCNVKRIRVLLASTDYAHKIGKGSCLIVFLRLLSNNIKETVDSQCNRCTIWLIINKGTTLSHPSKDLLDQ